MTKREFYNAIAAGTMNDELMEMASAELVKMDAALEKRKGTESKKAKENQPFVERIANEILGAEPMTAADVAAVMEITPQKASVLCRAAVAQKMANVQDVKIPKRGTCKGYTKA